jgi:glycosyltransferase involved in cell wall biosynthesis
MTKLYSTRLEEAKIGPEVIAAKPVPRFEPDVWKLLDRISFEFPDYVCPSAWLGHAPFAFWLVSKLRPRSFVELGVGRGFSYLTVCQAVSRLDLSTRCFGIDHWLGDEQAGFYTSDVFDTLKAYHDKKYLRFSTLVRSTFDDAGTTYEADSIDLLHIDGLHTYEAVRHDFDIWKSKLSRRGVILFHDTNVRGGDFGVYRLWNELAGLYPSFEFIHGHGLGVLGVGEDLPADLRLLFNANSDLAGEIREIYARLGETIQDRSTATQAKGEQGTSKKRIDDLERQLQTHTPLLAAAVERATKAEQAVAELVGARDKAIEELNWTNAELANLKDHSKITGETLSYVALDAARLQSEAGNKDLKIKELAQVTAMLSAERDAAAAELRIFTQRVRALKGAYALKARQVGELEARSRELLIEVAQQLEAVQQLQALAAELSQEADELAGARETLAALKQAFTQKTDEIKALNRKLDKAHEANARLELLAWKAAEDALLAAKHGQMEARLKDMAAAQERQRSEMDDLADEVKAAKDEMGSLITDYCTVRDRAAALTTEVERARRSRIWRAVSALNTLFERYERSMRRRLPFLYRGEETRKAQRKVAAVKVIAASKLFDRDWYLQRNPDVRASGMDPCYHYTAHGAKEGRHPGPFFDSKWYLEAYPDVSKAGLNPLSHYLMYGVQEGRRSRIVVDPAPYAAKQKAPKAARSSGPSREFGVNFVGPVSIASGLGTASRGYLGALAGAQVPARIFPVVEGFEHQKQLPFDVGNPPRRPYKISLVQLNADATQNALKLAPEEFSQDRYRVGLWVWELAAFPPEWHDCIERYDEIWVPSKFCQRSVSALSRKPVNVMPYVVPVSDAPLDLSVRQAWGLPEDAFVFLYMFDASSYLARKNPLSLIDAFVAEFGSNPKVVLVLKVSYAQFAHTEFEAVRKKCFGRPNIRLIDEVVEANQVLRFIDAADCYVSPHRSEGFGLTVAEAMSRGKPVIATDYGGTKDFLREENGYPIPYKLIEIDSKMGPYKKGYVWANPDMDALRSRMREVMSNPDSARNRGLQGTKDVRTMFNERAVGERLRSRLDEIWLAQKPRGFLGGAWKAPLSAERRIH